LEHSSSRHNAVLNKFEDLVLINGDGFEHFRARDNHGYEDDERWEEEERRIDLGGRES
jgi:hypothetical protein